MLLGRSRHASVQSLERYARPGVDALAAHVAASDPAGRRRGLTTAAYGTFTEFRRPRDKPQIMLFGDIMSNEFRIMTVVPPGDT